MTSPLELAAIVSIAVATRVPYLRYPASDIWHHLWFIRFYQEAGHVRRRDVARSLVRGYVAYPPLPHLLIARLPERYWVSAGIGGNVLYDLLTLLTVYLASAALLGRMGIHETFAGLSPAGAVALLWATGPILHPTSAASARLRAIGGRTLGNFLLLLYFLSLYGAFVAGQPAYYAACGVFGLLVLLSSQFGLQVLVFFSLGLTVFYMSAVPAATAAAVLVLAAGPGPLGLRRQIRGKLLHYRWYLRTLSARRIRVPRRPLDALRELPRLLARPGELARFALKDFTPAIALLNVPALLLLAYAVTGPGFVDRVLEGDPGATYAAAITTTALCTVVLTAVPPFVIFGEADRYLEYALPAVCVLTVLYLHAVDASAVSFVTLVGVQLIVIAANAAFVGALGSGEREPYHDTGQLAELLAFLRGSPRRRILTIPTKLSSLLGYHCYTQHDFYYTQVFSEENGLEHTLDAQVYYNYPRPDLEYFRETFGVDALVATKATLLDPPGGVDYGHVRALPVLFENKDFLVADLAGQKEATASTRDGDTVHAL